MATEAKLNQLLELLQQTDANHIVPQKKVAHPVALLQHKETNAATVPGVNEQLGLEELNGDDVAMAVKVAHQVVLMQHEVQLCRNINCSDPIDEGASINSYGPSWQPKQLTRFGCYRTKRCAAWQSNQTTRLCAKTHKEPKATMAEEVNQLFQLQQPNKSDVTMALRVAHRVPTDPHLPMQWQSKQLTACLCCYCVRSHTPKFQQK